jgi:hypothetical protein
MRENAKPRLLVPVNSRTSAPVRGASRKIACEDPSSANGAITSSRTAHSGSQGNTRGNSAPAPPSSAPAAVPATRASPALSVAPRLLCTITRQVITAQ